MLAEVSTSTSFSLARFLLPRSPFRLPIIVPLPDDLDVLIDLRFGAPLVAPPSLSSPLPSPDGFSLSESLNAESLSEELLDLTILRFLLEPN